MISLQILTSLLAIAATTEATNAHNRFAKRQSASSTTASSAQTTGSSSLATNDPLFTLTAAVTGVPVLGSITSGMPTGTPLSASTTYQEGTKPTFSGAPALPSPFVFQQGKWPAQDKVPPTDSAEVKAWMKELDGWNIPNIPKNVDNICANNPQGAQDAAKNGWWTCGSHTRDTDIIQCPEKQTWGVSFDDGPSDYTPKLLNYLSEKQIKSTFFVVGSRVISRPDILREEYIAGHEISVHTWSHAALTTLSNEQIVAEIGWTREAIKQVLGVTPTTMRPPYGDIDDRVRAICLAMGMIPIMWTSAPNGGTFDTFDWRVPGGLVNGVQQYKQFTEILKQASQLNNGFIVLQHDLYEISVDLAIGFTLDAALKHNSPFKLQPIGECSKIPTNNLYLESNTNQTFPFKNSTSGQSGSNGKTSSGSNAGNGALASSLPSSVFATYLLGAFAAVAALL
jgi:peptidoglycan/xylan/chitin deacetylase (PgdA/CDA1 family)